MHQDMARATRVVRRHALRLGAGVLSVIAAVLVIGPATTGRAAGGSGAMALDAAAEPGIQTSRDVSGATPFGVGVEITASIGLYKGFQWEIEFPSGLAFAGGVVNNTAATGLGTCTAAESSPGPGPGTTRVGGGAGCISVDPGYAGSSFVGEAATFQMRCVADGSWAVTLVDVAEDAAFGARLFDSSGADMSTTTAGVTINCSGVGAGGGGDRPACTIDHIVDGSTFVCADQTQVRMLQIETLPPGTCGGDWARAAQQYIFLTPGRTVYLEQDATKTDDEGHTLAAPIWIAPNGDEYNLSIVMVYVGLARASVVGSGNTRYYDWAQGAETWARVAQWNMWAPGKPYNGNGC